MSDFEIGTGEVWANIQLPGPMNPGWQLVIDGQFDRNLDLTWEVFTADRATLLATGTGTPDHRTFTISVPTPSPPGGAIAVRIRPVGDGVLITNPPALRDDADTTWIGPPPTEEPPGNDLVNWKIHLLQEAIDALVEEGEDTIVMVDVDNAVPGLAFFTVRFSLTGDALERVMG